MRMQPKLATLELLSTTFLLITAFAQEEEESGVTGWFEDSTEDSTPISSDSGIIQYNKSLTCYYQTCLELAQRVIRQYNKIKEKFPEFEYSLENDRCSMRNIPKGWHAFCEKRVYRLQSSRGESVKIMDTRRGCGFTNTQIKQEQSCTFKDNYEMASGSSGVIFNGTETVCRCFKDRCNGSSTIADNRLQLFYQILAFLVAFHLTFIL